MYSFVIPAYNEEDYLGETIDKINYILKLVNSEIKYEIIVCDNASTDKTPEIAKAKQCHLVNCSERSISKTRNTGAKVAKGDWIIFLDADSYPSEDLIREIITYEKSDKYIGFGACVKVIGGKKWFRFALESKNWSMKKFNWCLGGFICCKKDAYNDIGGFDENIYAFEEEYFIKKLKTKSNKLDMRFKVLESCFYTSGRKSESLTFVGFFKLTVNIWFNKKQTIRSRDKMKYWYK
jgi:glycosyltransferase involved in cell wall biosynthesis